MALFRTNQARQNLNDWLAQDPGSGSNSYGAALQSALSNAASRQTPAQRYNTGADQNVQDYRTDYRLMAQRAADTAAAGTEALSGGYGADYAASAAEQGRQILMEGQHDNEQALRQLAMEGYAAESSQADVLTQALLGAQQLETAANQLAQARFQAQRDFLTGEVQQAQAEQDNFWGNVWNGLQWLAQTALRTYDNYKGYTQQQVENWMDYQQFLAQEDQRQIDNERYNTEWTASREDAAWAQKMDELAFTAGRTDADREYDLAMQQLALDELAYQDDHAYKQAQIANMGRSSGGSGSSGGAGYDYSMSDLQKAISGYQDAKMLGDEAAMQMWASEAARMGYPQYLQGLGSSSAAPAASTGGNTTGVGQGISGLDYTSYAREMRAKGYSIPEIKEQFDAMRGNNTITSNMPTQADAAYVLAMANPNLTDEEIYRILNGG